MLKINKVNNAIKVEGLDNKQFPDNGTLMIPLNSVILTLDESNIATFRSAANNDVLFSGVIEDIEIAGASVTKGTIINAFGTISNAASGGGGESYDDTELRQELATEVQARIDGDAQLHNDIEAVETLIPDTSDMLTKTEAAQSYQPKGDYATTTALTEGLAEKADSADLATVATSGSYDDLSNKPTIPAAQIQSDWNQSDNTSADYIKNKPTNVSAFTNDAGYLTEHQDISGLATKSELAEVEAEIPSLEGYATEQWVENQNYLTEHQSLDNYYTKTQTDTAISTATNDMATETWVGQQGYLTEHQDISGLATKTELSDHTENTDIHVTALDKTNWNAKADLSDIPDVTGYINGAVYDSQTKRINFKHGDTVVAYIDATPFVVDGMVDTVEITGGNLVITWNTDAGKQSTSIPLTDIFNPDNYYSKTDTDALLAAKANSADLATVATSGDYDDLTNKPTIPTVPTNVSAFTNDAGYTTNEGTITGITMNGVSKGTSGVVDLGTVVTDKSDKQDTLVSGTNIKTINNESILGSGNITIEGGGGGITGIKMNGSAVSVTSGVADLGTVVTDVSGKQDAMKFYSPLSYNSSQKTLLLNIEIGKGDSGSGNFKMDGKANYQNKVTGDYAVALGGNNTVSGPYSAAIGGFDMYGAGSTVSGYTSIALGRSHNIAKSIATATGQGHTISNHYETAVGKYSQSNHSTDTFGDSGNTLFVVGNGTSASDRSNAFEIRQNGDIYITKDGQDVKLQDQLGGGGITGITMNGSPVTVTSGVADLGTVITEHQSLANYYTKTEIDTALANYRTEAEAINVEKTNAAAINDLKLMFEALVARVAALESA